MKCSNKLAAILTAGMLMVCLLVSPATAQDDLITQPGKRELRDLPRTETPPPLTVMSYNIKNIFSPPPNDWPTRLPKVAQIIEKHNPAIVGMQEALYPQVKDLLTALPAYDWIGLGRLGDSRDEFMAVFYQTARLEPLEFGHFWLSDTPRLMGSATWGHDNRRMVTWVLFREKAEGRIFYLLNTHFDHRAVEARAKSAGLLRDAMAALPGEVPIILMGDFNALAENSDPYTTLTEGAGLRDSWLTAAKRTGEGLNTFNGFRYDAHDGGRRIDWILYRGPLKATEAIIDNHSEGELYPSDHFPVVAAFDYE